MTTQSAVHAINEHPFISPGQEANGYINIKAFKNNFEHLEYIDSIARLYVAAALLRSTNSDSGTMKTKDLQINHIINKINKESKTEFFVPSTDLITLDVMESAIKRFESIIAQKVGKSIKKGVKLNFETLCHTYNLSSFERRILCLCFSHNTGTDFRQQFRKLDQNDPDQRDNDEITIGSILFILFSNYGDRLKNRKQFSIESALRKHELIIPQHGFHDSTNILENPVSLHERIERFIVGDDNLYDSDFRYISRERTEVKMDNVIINNELKHEILVQAQNFSFNQNSRHSMDSLDCRAKNSLRSFFGYGTGLSFFFYGPSGTGKTMMAHALANAIDKELLIINSKATEGPISVETVLEYVFKESKLKNGILFFDECDDIFKQDTYYSRSLLIELEKSDNITIFAANKVVTLDPALDRRITMKIPFGLPDAGQRELIWQALIPPDIEIAGDVNFSRLAEKYMFSGGLIKNTIITAINNKQTLENTGITLLASNDLTNAAEIQTRSLHDMDQMGKIYSPQKKITELPVTPSDRKKISRMAQACKQIYCKNHGLKIVLTSSNIETGVHCVDALATECKLQIKQYNFEDVFYDQLSDRDNIDPVTQKRMNLQDIIFRPAFGLPSLTVLVDPKETLCEILSEKKEKQKLEQCTFFNKLREYNGLIFIVTKPVHSMHLPLEFDHTIEIHTPVGEVQIKQWESYFGKNSSLENRIINLVEEYPLHLNEIDLIAQKAKLTDFIDSGLNTESVSIDSVYRLIRRYKGTNHIPLLFGNGI